MKRITAKMQVVQFRKFFENIETFARLLVLIITTITTLAGGLSEERADVTAPPAGGAQSPDDELATLA